MTASLIDRAYISQPATTAIQIALVSLFSSWGITPSAVVGHSSGEIGAAYAAGALSLEQCILIAYHRGLLAESLKLRRTQRPGGMLAVGASTVKMTPMIKKIGSGQVVIACINGPSLVTISGDVDAISELQTNVEEEGLFNRRLKVDVAYHSPHMHDIAGDYLEAIKLIRPSEDRGVQFHSSVLGRQIGTRELTSAYWVNNMTGPVHFVDGIQSMYTKGRGPDILIEIGPHSALMAPIKDIMKTSDSSSKVRYLPSLVRNHDANLTTLNLASALHVLGCRLNFSAINNPRDSHFPKPLNDLPSYPWNHSKRHWHESRLSVNHRLRRFPRSDLLGSLVDDFNENEPRWRNLLRVVDIPWLAHHKVQGSLVFPATGYLAMTLEATYQYGVLHNNPATSATQYRFREISISRPMVLSEDSPTEVSFVMRPREEGSREFSKSWMAFAVKSWTSQNGWIEHCHGLISLYQDDQAPNPINGERQKAVQQNQYKKVVDDLQMRCQSSVKVDDLYSRFSRAGLEFGPAFRNITEGQATTDHAIGTVSIPNTSSLMPNGAESRLPLHPVTFDACLQVIQIAHAGGDFSGSDLHVPTFFKDITVHHGLPNTPGDKLRVLASVRRLFDSVDSDIHAEILVVDAEDETRVLIEVHGFVASELPTQSTGDELNGDRRLCYQVLWEPCLDLLTRDQYAGTFTTQSDTPSAIRQMENLERAAYYYLDFALQALPEMPADVPQTHLANLHRVLCKLQVQVQQGDVPFQSPEWLSCSLEERKQFLSRFASSDDCGRLLCSMGESLVSILSGKVEPLSIMLKNNMLESYYRTSGLAKLGNETCTDIVSKLAHQDPNMRIIELGAGTGFATMPVLRALGLRFAHYDFTDISTGFFERAKEEQQKWGDKIRYRKLNVEEDPVTQGFEAGTYDLVIASNVLHATADMSNTMRNVRQLLRPGGKVVITDLTRQLLSNAVIFGTLPGKQS